MWTLTLLTFSLHVLWAFLYSSWVAAASCKGHKPSFLSWFLAKAFCSVCFLLILSLGMSGWRAPAPSQFPSWRMSGLPGLLCLPRDSAYPSHKQAKVCPLGIQHSSSTDPLPYFSKNWHMFGRFVSLEQFVGEGGWFNCFEEKCTNICS